MHDEWCWCMTTEKLKVISGAFSLTQSFPFSTRSVHKAKEKVVLNSFLRFWNRILFLTPCKWIRQGLFHSKTTRLQRKITTWKLSACLCHAFIFCVSSCAIKSILSSSVSCLPAPSDRNIYEARLSWRRSHQLLSGPVQGGGLTGLEGCQVTQCPE